MIALALALAPPASAQSRVAGQVHALAAIADATFVGGGVGGALRVGRRLELGATLNAGALERGLAGRAELLALFLLNPLQRRGPVLYGGGGVAVTGTEDALDERIVLLLGVRTSAARLGWFVEAGVGGGVRIAAGVRVRRRGR